MAVVCGEALLQDSSPEACPCWISDQSVQQRCPFGCPERRPETQAATVSATFPWSPFAWQEHKRQCSWWAAAGWLCHCCQLDQVLLQGHVGFCHWVPFQGGSCKNPLFCSYIFICNFFLIFFVAILPILL